MSHEMQSHRSPEVPGGEFYYLEEVSRAVGLEARVLYDGMFRKGPPETVRNYIRRRQTEYARHMVEPHGHIGETLCVDGPCIVRPSGEADTGQVIGRFCDVMFSSYPDYDFDGTLPGRRQGLLMALHTDLNTEYDPGRLEQHYERDDLRLVPVEPLTHIRTLQQAIHFDLMYERQVFLQCIDAFTEPSKEIQTVADLMDNRLRELAEECKITGKPVIVTAEDAILQPHETAPLYKCRQILIEGELTGFRCCDFGSENGADIYYEFKPDPDTILLAGSDIMPATETTRYYVPVSTDYELYSGYSKNFETEKS